MAAKTIAFFALQLDDATGTYSVVPITKLAKTDPNTGAHYDLDLQSGLVRMGAPKQDPNIGECATGPNGWAAFVRVK